MKNEALPTVIGADSTSTSTQSPHGPGGSFGSAAQAQSLDISRRTVVAAASSAAALALLGCATGAADGRPTSSTKKEDSKMSSLGRLPVVYVPHGGGPWPFVDVGFGDKEELDGLASYLRSIQAVPKVTPEAVLIVSAHWEEAVPTVMTSEAPPLLFDYYGFPPESYKLTWPAPGDPKLAARVRTLLESAGFQSGEDPTRGFDHGTFVPLKLTYPEANVKTVQLSLKKGLNPEEHIAIGRALAPLRDEGVFIIGSGMSYHNLRAFGPAGRGPAAEFDAWLGKAVTAEPSERDRLLSEWSKAPSARAAHPREEHLLPLMVIAGAAGSDLAQTAYRGSLMGLRLSGFQFG